MSSVVPVTRDKAQQPVPTIWREPLKAMVDRLLAGDFLLSGAPKGVRAVSPDLAQMVRDAIIEYGATLISLPEAAWESSVCLWMRSYWEVLVDLFTVEEGRSDLVMSVRVYEEDDGFVFVLMWVHVP